MGLEAFSGGDEAQLPGTQGWGCCGGRGCRVNSHGQHVTLRSSHPCSLFQRLAIASPGVLRLFLLTLMKFPLCLCNRQCVFSLESQTRPVCANASVAVRQDILQGRQPKTHGDLSLGYEQLWSVGNVNTWSVTVSPRLPLGESASLVLGVSENMCRCVSQGRREGRPGARIGRYFVFKFSAASCCFG